MLLENTTVIISIDTTKILAGSSLFYHRIWYITPGLDTYALLENNYSWDVNKYQAILFLFLFVISGVLVHPVLLDKDNK